MGATDFTELNAAAEALGDLRAFAAWERTPAPAELDAGRTWARLQNAMRDALLSDPTAVVETPAWDQKRTPAFEVVSDSFAGKTGDQSLQQLLAIVGKVARGEDARAVADAWIRAVAMEYANWHLDDAMAAEDGDA